MNAQAVINTARRLLADEYSEYFSPESLIDYLNTGQRELLKRRPYLRQSASGTLVSVNNVESLSDDLVVDEDHLTALASWVSAQALMEDDKDTRNVQKGQMLLKFFYEAI